MKTRLNIKKSSVKFTCTQIKYVNNIYFSTTYETYMYDLTLKYKKYIYICVCFNLKVCVHLLLLCTMYLKIC